MGYVGKKPTAAPLTASDVTDGIITSAKIASNAVTSAKINDGTITLADLSATGTASASTFLRGDNSFAEAGGGKLLQYKVSSDSTGRSQGGNFTNQTLNNTLGNTITPTKVGSLITIQTSDIYWFSYGGATIYMNIDGSPVMQRANGVANTSWSTAEQTTLAFNYQFTTTSLNQITVSFTMTDGGSTGGSAGFSFGNHDGTKGFCVIKEIDQ